MTTKDPYAVFSPRRGALVARACAVATVAVVGGLAVLAPGDWPLADRVLLAVFGLVAAAGLWRFGMVRAVASADGLRVINLVHSRELEWAEILRVSLADGSPWVLLELADTEELAVMGIQRADGAFGRAEAARLAALVQHHST